MALSLAAASLLAACTAPGGPDRIKYSFGTGVVDAGPDDAISNMQVELKCRPASVAHSMTYPARSTVTTGESHASTQPTYFVSDLYSLFDSSCGTCHVHSDSGGWVVGVSNFGSKIDQHVFDRIESNDPKLFMPPDGGGGKAFRDRADNDPVKALDTLLHQWIDQGRPANSFLLPVTDTSSSDSTTPYLLSPDLGNAMTNIGTCVPDRGMVGTSASAMDSLDTFFAQATDLPATLDKTDLYTLDSEALAREGVVSYQPTYPLWTDNAGKMRYVRVPRGKSIVFDKTTQQFQIPPNTRFYKTFLKQVKDVNGNMGWRKIETRVIVSRPDIDLPDGTVKQTALFGTYLWNADETQATLQNVPLRNGQPFADRIFTYITDEQAAQSIIDAAPADEASQLQDAGLLRHYAVPGSERCIQCHMGSPNKAFILAFSPLQINRRKAGTGGLYEPGAGETVSDEELSQLQRLIDYGVISGMTSPADVLPLEESQGTRHARTAEELNAQAYMLGNCSHCHNPRGLPTVREPAVGEMLNFLPGAGPNQGIFEFSLDKVSPVRKRGLLQDTDIPYITPSLYDIPVGGPVGKFFCPEEEAGSCTYNYDPDPSKPPVPVPKFEWVLAPWRSLIYRNVDTPYDYFDDYALFPHMPLNSPGYDCRAAQKMGDWMVSIPAVLKDPTKSDSARPFLQDLSTWGSTADLDAQPYREVKPGDPEFEEANTAAKARLDRYHAGVRYGFCPDSYTKDIIDSKIQDAADRNQPLPSNLGPFIVKDDVSHIMMPAITPFGPHFVALDDTDQLGDWFPRRTDWESAIVNPDITAFVANAKIAQHLKVDELADLQNVLTALTSVSLDEVRTELTTEVPFGLWDTSKPGCDFSGVPTVASFKDARPQWMTIASPAATAPVYVESPGAAVFTSICYNCHGQNADSKGLLAEEISTLTGGGARVANFRDGLFGPVTMPGQNRSKVFDPSAAKVMGPKVTGDDLAARYLAWMALGGTSKFLPTDVLTQVSQSPVLGVLRGDHISPTGTPDMLRLGLELCSQLAASEEHAQQIGLSDLFTGNPIRWNSYTALVDRNYDAEMWLRLCSLGNRPLVRVPLVSGEGWTATTGVGDLFVSGFNLYWGASEKDKDGKVDDYYGANPAIDSMGNITTGLAGNTFPMCIAKPGDPAQLNIATQWLAAHKVRGNVVPFCPPGLVTDDHKLHAVNSPASFPDGRKWAARGAINAALAVFLYLDDIERHPEHRKPLYNQCSALGKK
jgi:mono/diheme cytochrome c family protein